MSIYIDEFEKVYNASVSIQGLRDKVLQLAIEGKLVEQDPNDEPANVLIERIKVERDKLVKEKKIKKPKKFEPITEDEIPFEIPEGWEYEKIGNVIDEIFGGGTPSKSNPRYWNGNLKWASVKDFSDSDVFLNDTVERITEMGLEKSSSRIVEEGNLIISTRMGLGRIVICKDDIAINQDLKGVKLSEELNRLFFLFAYKSLKIEGTGTTVKGIKQDKLLNIGIPIPPRAEQDRIMTRFKLLMSEIDQLEEKLRRKEHLLELLPNAVVDAIASCETGEELKTQLWFVIENFEEIFQSPESMQDLRNVILQLAIEGKLVEQDSNDEPASVLIERIIVERDKLVKEKKIKKPKKLEPITEDEIPFEIPESWEWIRLDNLCKLITKGSSPKWQGISYVDNEEVLFVTSENVGNNEMLLSKRKYVEFKFNDLQPRSILNKNDILMNIVGASIGRTAIYQSDVLANINQAVCLIRFMDDSMNLGYMLNFFNSTTCIGFMYDKQVDNARANLSMGNISKFLIPVPPAEEQSRINNKVAYLMSIIDKMEVELKKKQRIVELLGTG